MIYLYTIFFGLGIVLQKYFNFNQYLLIFLFLLLLFIFISFRFVNENNSSEFEQKNIFEFKNILILIFLFLGIFRFIFFESLPDKNLLNLIGTNISFEAEIIKEPDVRDSKIFYIVKLINPNDLSKSFVMLIGERFPKFDFGGKIKVFGKLELPKKFLLENGEYFDYVSFLAKDNIHFMIYGPVLEEIENDEISILNFLYKIKYLFIEKIENILPEPNASLLAGIIFGVKNSLGNDLLNQFKTVGLIHIIVLSGYNLTIILNAVFYITSKFNRKFFSFILVLFFISIFVLMVGLSATILRALIMTLISLLAKYFGRPNDALRALFLAGFFMVLWNPYTLLYDPSFHLSFLATLGLILFSPIVDSFLVSKIKFIYNKDYLREIISSSIAVQIFILPLLIKISGIFSLSSFLVNLLVLPIIPVLMLSGFLTGLLGFVSYFLAFPFGLISFILTEFIIYIVNFFSSISFLIFKFKSISNILVLICYLFYFYIFYKFKNIVSLKKIDF